MTSDARKGFGYRSCALTLTMTLVLCAESPAQSSQWMLGVRTETISENHMIAGDPPGGMRRGGGYVTVYMLRITDVLAGSAAERAGLKRGDVIESVNGRSVKNPNDLTRLVRGSSGVLDLSLKGRNGGRTKKIDLRVTGAVGGGGTVPTQLEEVYVPHMGIYYKKVPYQNGTFGAQLTRDAVPGSPASQFVLGGSPQLSRLEQGDTIFEMDAQRFQTDDDVRNHRSSTTFRFVDSRTGQTMAGSFTLP
jgi:PDZ domain